MEGCKPIKVEGPRKLAVSIFAYDRQREKPKKKKLSGDSEA